MTSREFQDRLRRRARKAGITISPALAASLETYFGLLAVWNERINLTGFPLAEVSPDAIDRLLIEPLVAAGHVVPGVKTVLDVGSGGGSPAIPMTLALPQTAMLMVESKTRKSVFLREVLRALELTRASVVTARLEELLSRPDLHEAHDLVTVRAVRLETRNLLALQAFVKPGGQIFLFRTAGATDPAEVVPPLLAWRATFPLLEGLRSRLVVLEKLPGRGYVPRGTL